MIPGLGDAKPASSCSFGVSPPTQGPMRPLRKVVIVCAGWVCLDGAGLHCCSLAGQTTSLMLKLACAWVGPSAIDPLLRTTVPLAA